MIILCSMMVMFNLFLAYMAVMSDQIVLSLVWTATALFWASALMRLYENGRND